MADNNPTLFNPAAASVANNAVSVIFDTTYGFRGTPSTTVVGPDRGRFIRKRIAGFVDCTTQNVTLRLDYLASDSTWTTGAVSSTVTASTTLPFDWLPVAADWRVVTLNGATGPATLTFAGCNLNDNPNAGT